MYQSDLNIFKERNNVNNKMKNFKSLKQFLKQTSTQEFTITKNKIHAYLKRSFKVLELGLSITKSIKLIRP